MRPSGDAASESDNVVARRRVPPLPAGKYIFGIFDWPDKPLYPLSESAHVVFSDMVLQLAPAAR